tara:strand:+ start:2711 stop:2851 length:141 start_codon:yes stop_codon:yes gene_type:complete
MYRVTVRPTDGQRMMVLLQAEDAERAVKYALNRWPGAAVGEAKPVT